VNISNLIQGRISSLSHPCNMLVVFLPGLLEVNQRRARLVLGWVTVCRRVNHIGM